ncbi:aspartic peptidase domain-containing protein [Pilobolus umbonatus]|nr:aspartic peptidase domain-containing protein [Pilobolus umbonatus]
MADSIHRIPLYRKRTEDPDFISTPANDLANGMLGGMIEIGNPPQKFIVAFDTSTGFSWVTSNRCTSENCQGRRSYNAEESSTAVDVGIDFKVDYGTEGISSTLYLDTLRFAGITIEEMPFGSAYQMSGFTQGFDGFLGLGRNVNLNKSEIHYAKRDIPASGFIPNSYQQSSSIRSAQFGMYVLSYGGGFSETGYVSSHYYSNSVTSGGFGYLKRNYRKDKDEPAGYLILGKPSPTFFSLVCVCVCVCV